MPCAQRVNEGKEEEVHCNILAKGSRNATSEGSNDRETLWSNSEEFPVVVAK